MQSDPDWKPGNNFWYFHFPVDKGPLGAYTAELMAATGIPSDFSNHSLRHTTATRLHHKNVGKQLIKEHTGYHSNAVKRYAKTSMKQKQKVSDLLNVLPKGVQVVNKEKSGDEENLDPKEGKTSEKTNVVTVPSKQNEPLNVDFVIPQNVRDLDALGPLVNINFHFHK